MCEVQWMQPSAKNFEQFLQRLEPMKTLYRQQGYKYCTRWE